MNQFIKRLLQFSIGPFSGAIISFITIPLITHLLLPEELGRVGMFTLTQTLMPTICLGLTQAYTREFHVQEDKNNLLLNAIKYPFVFAIIVFIIFSLGSNFFSRLLFEYEGYNLAVCLIGFSGIVIVLERFILLKVRMEEKALEYSIFMLTIKIVVFLLTFVFIIFIRTDFLAIVYATIIGRMIVCFILFFRYINISDLLVFKIDRK